MFERLIEFVLHAKSGVVAAVFLLGTTGALVTATVENGVTTITITPSTATPTATVSPTSTATATPTATASSSSSPKSSRSPKPSSSENPACADEAHTINAAVQEVNTAASQFHSSLSKMHESVRGGDTARKDLDNADRLIKQIHQDAVKAIHETRTCAGSEADKDQDKADEDKNDDNNQDENDDQDSKKSSQQNFLLVFFSNLLGRNTTNTTATPTPTATTTVSTGITFSGSDPKAIADQAVAAMKLVFDTATANLQTATPAPRHTQSARPQGTHKAAPTREHDGHEDND